MANTPYPIPNALIQIILQAESEKLRKFAWKITKVPEKIIIPEEYIVEKREGGGEREDG
jgi:hypothetical protein